MYDELLLHGYAPQYATEAVANNLQEIGLTDCVVAEQNDIKINYYCFDNHDAAKTTYNKAVSLIHKERRDPPTRDYSEGNSNHWRYTLIGKSMYSTALYVGNTAIYAYSNTENADKINDLLRDIGYTKIEGSGESSRKMSPIFGVVFTIVWLPLALISQHWLWPLVYSSSGTTSKELSMFLKKNSKRVSKYKQIMWLFQKSIRPLQTFFWATIYSLPLVLECIAILVAIINVFIDLGVIFDIYIFVVVGTIFCLAIVGIFLNKKIYKIK